MSAERVDARTDEALAAGGFADMRPGYRTMLRRLKEQDAEVFAEATRRYGQVLVPAVAGGRAEPVAAWVEYGAWLARMLAPGRLVRIDATGRAEDAEPGPEPGLVLLHLPDDERERAIPILCPAGPSAAQQAALELLAD